MPHKSYQAILDELKAAEMLVKVGGTYSHYKNASHLVKVVALGIQEATDRLCVIYRDAANPRLAFVRDLDIWLEEPVKGTPRFRLVGE